MDYYICSYCGLEIPPGNTSCPACGHDNLKKTKHISVKKESRGTSLGDYFSGLSDDALLKIIPEDLRLNALTLYNEEIRKRGLSPLIVETGSEKKSGKSLESFFSSLFLIVIILLGLFFLFYIITLIPTH